MKAIILARVSSEEREQWHSIPAHVRRLQEYAERKGMRVIETHAITESSTTDSRKEDEFVLSKNSDGTPGRN